MTAPTLTLNAAAITRRCKAAGIYVTSHRHPRTPDAVRVVPVTEDNPAAARQVRNLLIQAGYDAAVSHLAADLDKPGDVVLVTLPEPIDQVTDVDQETGDTFDADGLQVGNLHDGETEPGAPLAPLAADGLPPIGDPRWIESKARGIGMGALLAELAADVPTGPTRRQLRAAARRDRTARRAKASGKAPRVALPRHAIAAALTRDAVTVRVPEAERTETARAHLHAFADAVRRGPTRKPTEPEPEPAGPVVVVAVSNAYECGRETTARVTVPAPPSLDDDPRGEILADWWEDVVHPHTGDGHPCGSTDHALYEAQIVEAPGRPELVGSSYGWEG